MGLTKSPYPPYERGDLEGFLMKSDRTLSKCGMRLTSKLRTSLRGFQPGAFRKPDCSLAKGTNRFDLRAPWPIPIGLGIPMPGPTPGGQKPGPHIGAGGIQPAGAHAMRGGGQHPSPLIPSTRQSTSLNGKDTTPVTTIHAPLAILASGFSLSLHAGGGQGGGPHIG